MHVGLGLLIVVVLLIPVMLLCKPCFFRGEEAHEEENEIEFANIQNVENNQIQGEDDAEDAMRKRQNEMKSLEKQI